MSYATASDVHQLHTGRPTFTGSSRPSLAEVNRFLTLTAAEIDGILRARNYVVPVPTTATSAFDLVSHGNALGAHAMVEQGAEISDRRDQAYQLWRDFKRFLESADLALDDATDSTTGVPQYGSSASAMFTWPAVDSLGNSVTDV
jgi:hypothetical protein